jgi:type IV pilus assembly protein PilE
MKKIINTNGLSLIELMITIFMVAILVTAAVTLYSSNVRKGRRIDALNSLISISLAEEKYRSNNSLYGTLAQVWGGGSTSSEGYYTLSVSNVTATSYTITATASGNQANDRENGVSCSALQLAVSNGTMTKSPADCWPK